MGYVYWCAACGNPEIIVENTKTGYSMGKGIVGAAVLGPVGAVAGLDGKDSVTYYCPKCGAKLDHCMPDYEVSDILSMLKNPDVFSRSIEEKRKRYPNMMLPKDWVATSEKTESAPKLPGNPDIDYVKKLLRTSKGFEFEDKLYEYLKQYGVISNEVIDSFYDVLYSNEQEYEIWSASLNNLIESYKIRNEYINGKYAYVVAKDAEEVKAWRREASADKTPIDNYLDFVKGLIKDKPRTINEIEQEIVKKAPNINKDNPYTALSIAKRVCAEIDKKDARVDFDGINIKINSTKLAEEDLQWKIKDKWNSSNHKRELRAQVRIMAPIIKSKSKFTNADVAGASPLLTAQRTAALLKYLCDDGYAVKQKLGNVNYFILTPEAKAWNTEDFQNWILVHFVTRGLGADKYRTEALELLKQNSGKSFWDMIGDDATSGYAEMIYEMLMAFELSGIARKTERSTEYIWEYIDKNAALREKLEKEKKLLEKEIEKYQEESSEVISRNNELLKELKLRTFDDSEYVAKMNELDQIKAELSAKLSSLGLFKFSEKKQVNEQIAKCEKDLGEVESRLASARKSFSDEITRLTSKYSHEIDECNKTLSEKNSRLREVINKLSGL